MKKLLAALAFVVVMSACADTAAGSTSQGSSGGNSGGGQASINLTVSGAMQATSTQLNKAECGGAQYGVFFDTLSPFVNGKEYRLQVSVPVTKTPVTVDLSTPDNHVLLELNDMKTGTGGWRNVDQSTGTITIDAGGDSGSADVHNLSNLLPGTYATTIDLKLTFTCPAKK